MKVIITGAGGFLGSYAVAAMLERGHEVMAIVRNESNISRIESLSSQIELCRMDLAASTELISSCTRFQPEAFVHCAWQGISERHRADFRNDIDQVGNIQQMAEIMLIAKQSGVQTVLGIGSQAEYGPKSHSIDETALLMPTSLYGAAKVSCWYICNQLAQTLNLRFIWLRMFSLYGAKDHRSLLVPSTAIKFIRGEQPALSPGEQLWDYLHVLDGARAIVCALESEEVHGAYNIGSGEVHSIKSIVEKLKELSGSAVEPAFGAVPYRTDQVMHLQANITAFKNATGWFPQIALNEGLAEVINYYRATELHPTNDNMS